MKIIHPYLVSAVLLLTLLGCDNKSKLTEKDLMSEGLPIKIMAPDSVQVSFDDMGIIKEMSVKGEGNYNIQIQATSTDGTNLSKILSSEKEAVKSSTLFSKIISEDEDGFIFEKKIDDDYINYDFRVVKVRGDQKYIYKTGLGGQYTLDNVKLMYNSVK